MSKTQKQKPPYIGFTSSGAQHLSQILLDVQISPYQAEPLHQQLSAMPFFKASIDLSLPHTQFSESVVRHLDLTLSNHVDIYLPNQIRFSNIAIQIAPKAAPADCILGMDFVNTGDIALSSHNGKTVFSYRTPPQGGLDFVAMAAKQRPMTKRGITAAGRDQPCPCGSGKKHGNCCAKLH